MKNEIRLDDLPVAGAEAWTFTQTFTPEEGAKLIELDEFMAWPAHRDENQGFWFPPPTGEQVKVYCKSYEKDDSNPNLRKRLVTVVRIPPVN